MSVDVGHYKTIEDFADEFDLNILKYYSDLDNQEIDDTAQYDSTNAKDLLYELESKHKAVFEKLAERLGTSDVRDMEDLIDTDEDGDYEDLKDAISDGVRAGTESAIYKKVQKCLADCGLVESPNGNEYVLWGRLRDIITTFLDDDGKDLNMNEWLSEKHSFVDFCNDPKLVAKQLEIEDMDEPNYGFYGYDESAAVEYLVDNL